MKTHLQSFLPSVALLLLVACGGKVVFEIDGGGGAGGAASVTSSTKSAVETSSGTSKSCNSNKDCQPNSLCIHADGLCGKGEVGTCTEQISHPCPVLPPMCFCDGTVSSTCIVADLSKDPTFCSHGTFSCGSSQCKKYLEFCHEAAIGPSGGGPFFECQPAPTSCTDGLIDCNCLESDNGMCTSDGDGGIHLSSP